MLHLFVCLFVLLWLLSCQHITVLGLSQFHECSLLPTLLDQGSKQLLKAGAILKVDKLKPEIHTVLGHMFP